MKIFLSSTICISLILSALHSHAIPSWEFGVSLEQTLARDSTNNIITAIKNTGKEPILLDFMLGPPKLGVTGWGFGFEEGPGTLNIFTPGIIDFPLVSFSSFSGVYLNPNKIFSFVFAQLNVPATNLIGDTSTTSLGIDILLPNNLFGTLVGSQNNFFDLRPRVTLVVGEVPSVSDLTFFPGLVVDQADHPCRATPCSPFPLPAPPSVPEPSTIWLFSTGLIGFIAWQYQQRSRRSNTLFTNP